MLEGSLISTSHRDSLSKDVQLSNEGGVLAHDFWPVRPFPWDPKPHVTDENLLLEIFKGKKQVLPTGPLVRYPPQLDVFSIRANPIVHETLSHLSASDTVTCNSALREFLLDKLS